MQGAGTSPKTVYRTVDGGQHWTVAATTGPIGGTPNSPTPTVNSGLPIVGYLHYLYFGNALDGWIGIDRSGFFDTTDGGSTWHYAWSSTFPIGTDYAPSLGMLASGFGWLVETDMKGNGATLTSLYTTADNGGKWTEVYRPSRP